MMMLIMMMMMTGIYHHKIGSFVLGTLHILPHLIFITSSKVSTVVIFILLIRNSSHRQIKSFA